MSDDNTFENDSDKSNVVPLFGSEPKINVTSFETPTGSGLQEILDAIISISAKEDDGEMFDLTIAKNNKAYPPYSSLEIDACKVETTLFIMEDMISTLQMNPIVTRDDKLWSAVLALQECITKTLNRNKQILESGEENDEQ